MAVLGMRGTGNLATDELGVEFMEGLLWLDEVRDNAPLLGIASRISSLRTTEYTFNHFEQRPRTRRIVTNAGNLLATDTVLTFADAIGGNGVSLNLRAGNLIINNRTRERCRVTLDPTTNTSTITVVRGVGGTAAQAIVNGDSWIIYTVASEDASAAASMVSNDPSKVQNFTQTLRQTIKVSRRLARSYVRTGPAYDKLKREMLNYLLSFIEGAFIWGTKSDSAGSVAGQRITTTGGIVELISSNFKDFLGTVTWSTLLTQIEQVFRFSKKREKLVLAGGIALSTIDRLAMLQGNPLMSVPDITSYGVELRMLKTSHGRLMLAYHPELGQVSDVNKHALVIDPQFLAYRYLGDKDIDLKLNIIPDMDGFADEWVTDCGLQAGLQESHAEWDNMTNGQI